MKSKLIVLFILSFLSNMMCNATSAQKKVAIYVMNQWSDYCRKMGNYLVEEFVNNDDFSAVERSRAFLAELSKEQSYQQSGNVYVEEITKIGQQFGVDYIVTIDAFKIMSGERINVRMIDIEMARIIASSYKPIIEGESISVVARDIYKDLTNVFMEYDRSIFPNISVYVSGDQYWENKKHLNCAFIEAFSQVKYLNVLERSKTLLEGINMELGYQQSGAVSDSEIAELGKQAGANFICVVECKRTFIATRIINTETGAIIGANNQEFQNIMSVDKAKLFAKTLVSNDNIADYFLTIIENISTDQNLKKRLIFWENRDNFSYPDETKNHFRRATENFLNEHRIVPTNLQGDLSEYIYSEMGKYLWDYFICYTNGKKIVDYVPITNKSHDEAVVIGHDIGLYVKCDLYCDGIIRNIKFIPKQEQRGYSPLILLQYLPYLSNNAKNYLKKDLSKYKFDGLRCTLAINLIAEYDLVRAGRKIFISEKGRCYTF